MKKFTIFKTTPFFWYGKNLLSKCISYLLWPLACLYCVIIVARQLCYRYGICKIHRLKVPVIVVGNITVGGTGKTPLVIWLAIFLREHGYKPGIVSRGYGRSSSGIREVTATSLAAEVGDEALMIVQSTDCPMIVGESRVVAAQKLVENTDCNVIVSDDGLQHYALGRDLEIVVQDGERNLGNGLCLPAGPLREPASRLQHIDFIIKNIGINGGDVLPMPKTKAGNVPCYTMQFVPECFCQVGDAKKQISLNDLVRLVQDKTCHAVAGIGNPVRFFRQLRDLGLQLQEHGFPDHYAYIKEDFIFAGEDVVIMTQKDAVKCQNFAKENWWYLRISAKLSEEFAADFKKRLQ